MISRGHGVAIVVVASSLRGLLPECCGASQLRCLIPCGFVPHPWSGRFLPPGLQEIWDGTHCVGATAVVLTLSQRDAASHDALHMLRTCRRSRTDVEHKGRRVATRDLSSHRDCWFCPCRACSGCTTRVTMPRVRVAPCVRCTGPISNATACCIVSGASCVWVIGRFPRA